MRQRIFISLAFLIATGCPGPVDPDDGGPDTDGGLDGSTDQCTRHGDCGDQALFCARWRCEPGTAGADARGCIDLGPPCEAGQECDEDADACGQPAWCTEGRDGCLSPGDCDGDGSLHQLECGGDDCDDDDPNRKPGNLEVCDAEGHDEDCDLETFAGPDDGDLDGDGFISAMCCNGDACGNDCDDSDINVNPGAAEVCDGIDNDCSGAADDADGLCPGGLCAGGVCSFTAWDRVISGTNNEFAHAVAFDDAGNVYVGGMADAGTIRFGGGPMDFAEPVVFVLKMAPDGGFDWVFTAPATGNPLFSGVFDIDIAPDGTVWAVGNASDLELGTGPATRGAFVFALDSAGNLLRHQIFEGGRTGVHQELTAVIADGTGIFVGGSIVTPVTFGTETLTPSGSRTGLVLRFASDLTPVWHRIYPMSGSDSLRKSAVTALAPTATGGVIAALEPVGGSVTVAGRTFNAVDSGARRTAAIITEIPAGSGAEPWATEIVGLHYDFGGIQTGSGAFTPTGMVVDGTDLFVVGTFRARIEVAGEVHASSMPNPSGYSQSMALMRMNTSGDIEWSLSVAAERCCPPGASDGDAPPEVIPAGVAIDPLNRLVIAGTFQGAVSFGGGVVRGNSRAGFPSGFVTRLNRNTGSHVGEVVYGLDANLRVEDIAVGPGNVTAVCGRFGGTASFVGVPRVSTLTDAFVLRMSSL